MRGSRRGPGRSTRAAACALLAALLLAAPSAAARRPPLAIRNLTLHLPYGLPTPDATLVIEDDRVRDSGDDVVLQGDETVEDGHGLHAFPGLIAAGGASPAVFPYARARGVLVALVIPPGGPVAGISRLVHTATADGRDSVIAAEVALHVRWPAQGAGPLARDFARARARAAAIRAGRAVPNVGPAQARRMAAIDEAQRNMVPTFVHVNGLEPVRAALAWTRSEGLRRVVLVGGAESWRLADSLRARDVAVIAEPAPEARLAAARDSAPADSFPLPARLAAAGVRYCIADADPPAGDVPDPVRAARRAVASGLPPQAAFDAVTVGAARVLGQDKAVGTLLGGWYADVALASGDPLDPGTRIEALRVMGRPVSLGNPALPPVVRRSASVPPPRRRR